MVSISEASAALLAAALEIFCAVSDICRLPTAIRPLLRQRHTPAHAVRTDEDQRTTAALDEQNVQSLTGQRVERVGHLQRTQRLPGRRGTMPCPSEYRVGAVSHSTSVGSRALAQRA